MINVAIIGAGYWGPNLVRTFNSIDNVIVKYVIDKDLNRRKFIKSEFSDLEVLGDMDIALNDEDISNLSPGSYKVVVKDANDCEITSQEYLVEEPNELLIENATLTANAGAGVIANDTGGDTENLAVTWNAKRAVTGPLSKKRVARSSLTSESQRTPPATVKE